MLKEGAKVKVIGVIELVDSDDKVLPYSVRFNKSQVFWFGDDVCKPRKSKVAASSTSSNSSYTAAALREKCRKYFPAASTSKINNFIKSVQRLNASKAKHCA